MKTTLVAAFVLIALSACSAPDTSAPGSNAASTASLQYVNERFGFTVDIPSNFVPQGESDNGDGQVFAASGHRAEIRAWGSNLIKPDIRCSASSMFAEELPQPTYEHSRDGTSVVSGNIGSDIFYAKVIRTADRCLGLTITYPVSDKAAYDPTVSSVAASFKG